MGTFIIEFARNFAVDTLQYLFFAGTTFLLFWVILRKRLLHRVIQKKFSTRERIQSEFLYSMSSIVVFSIIGIGSGYLIKNDFTRLYTDADTYGLFYFGASVVLFLFLHDFYFYWTHRLMHHPKIFKHVHLVHHKSTNPSPWAAFSFHPSEAVVQGLFFPMAILLIPIHIKALVVTVLISLLYNVLGHLSIELLPKGFTRSILFWHNVPTHHNMHHKYFNANYGLYFNIWDRIGGTLHAKYDETFDEVTSREPIVDVKGAEKVTEPIEVGAS